MFLFCPPPHPPNPLTHFPPLRIQRRMQLYEPMTAERFWGLNVFIQALTPLRLAVLLSARLPCDSVKEKFSNKRDWKALRCQMFVRVKIRPQKHLVGLFPSKSQTANWFKYYM